MNWNEWKECPIGYEPEPMARPPIDKTQLLKYAGASLDFNLIHVDEATARLRGLDGIIAHGMLSMGFIGHYVAQLAGPQGFVSSLQVRFSRMVKVGDVLTCRAKVKAMDVEKRAVTMEVSAEREPGNPVTAGEAVIRLDWRS